MCPEQGTGGRGGGGAGRLTQVGFAHKGRGEGGFGRAGRLQASDPREAFHARPQVSCFQGSRFGFQGLGFRVQVWGARS